MGRGRARRRRRGGGRAAPPAHRPTSDVAGRRLVVDEALVQLLRHLRECRDEVEAGDAEVIPGATYRFSRFCRPGGLTRRHIKTLSWAAGRACGSCGEPLLVLKVDAVDSDAARLLVVCPGCRVQETLLVAAFVVRGVIAKALSSWTP